LYLYCVHIVKGLKVAVSRMSMRLSLADKNKLSLYNEIRALTNNELSLKKTSDV